MAIEANDNANLELLVRMTAHALLVTLDELERAVQPVLVQKREPLVEAIETINLDRLIVSDELRLIAQAP